MRKKDAERKMALAPALAEARRRADRERLAANRSFKTSLVPRDPKARDNFREPVPRKISAGQAEWRARMDAKYGLTNISNWNQPDPKVVAVLKGLEDLAA